MTGFHFASPAFLWLLLLLPVWALLTGRTGRPAALRHSSIGLLGLKGKTPRNAAGRIWLTLRLLAAAAAILALARPQQGEEYEETTKEGVDIVLAIDLSASMWAHDMRDAQGRLTDRLSALKPIVAEFLSRRPDDRVALVVFSGVAFRASPLTNNHGHIIRSLNRALPGSIADQGTNIGHALATALVELVPAAGTPAAADQAAPRSRVIILLTDGDSNRNYNLLTPKAGAEEARKLGIRVHTIGVGEEGLVLAPPQGGYVDNRPDRPRRDAEGKIILTRTLSSIDMRLLDEIAATTGGKSFRAKDARTLSGIYDTINAMERTERIVSRHVRQIDRFTWFVAAALGILLLEQALALTLWRRVP